MAEYREGDNTVELLYYFLDYFYQELPIQMSSLESFFPDQFLNLKINLNIQQKSFIFNKSESLSQLYYSVMGEFKVNYKDIKLDISPSQQAQLKNIRSLGYNGFANNSLYLQNVFLDNYEKVDLLHNRKFTPKARDLFIKIF